MQQEKWKKRRAWLGPSSQVKARHVILRIWKSALCPYIYIARPSAKNIGYLILLPHILFNKSPSKYHSFDWFVPARLRPEKNYWMWLEWMTNIFQAFSSHVSRKWNRKPAYTAQQKRVEINQAFLKGKMSQFTVQSVRDPHKAEE